MSVRLKALKSDSGDYATQVLKGDIMIWGLSRKHCPGEL